MKIKKYAAIDIGSNAVRLLISNVIEREGKPEIFRKYSLSRIPVRLGNDVFLNKKISTENKERLCKTVKAFGLIMEVNKVECFRACATSAMREAENGKEVVDYILKNTGIKIEIIDGSNEAGIIANNHLSAIFDDQNNYLYVDVGGGSTEFTIYAKGKIVAAKSFEIGTLRLLNNKVLESTWKNAEQWVKTNLENTKETAIVGSGGNVNKIFKMSRKPDNEPIELEYLETLYNTLQAYSFEDKVCVLGLNEDRADVITHACLIYLRTMKWSQASKLFVPKVGLSDGIIKSLYYENKQSHRDAIHNG